VEPNEVLTLLMLVFALHGFFFRPPPAGPYLLPGEDQDADEDWSPIDWGQSFRVAGGSREYVLRPDSMNKRYGWLLWVDGQHVAWDCVDPGDEFWAAPIVGTEAEPPKAQRIFKREWFDAGSRVILRPDRRDEHGPDAVAVWDFGREARVGFLPEEWAAVVAEELDAGWPIDPLVIWERVGKEGERECVYLLFLRLGMHLAGADESSLS
jgi:hypothetical protein